MALKRQVYAGPEKSAGYHGPYHQAHPVGQQARDDKTTGHLHKPRWGIDQKPGHDYSGPPSVKSDNCYPASDRSDGRPAADLSGGKPVCDYSER
jgi:hypothetical protein